MKGSPHLLPHALLLAMLLAPLPGSAIAKDPGLQTIVREQQAMRAKVEAGDGIYIGLSAEERSRLFEQQDVLFRTIGTHERLEELGGTDQADVQNRLATIRGLIDAGRSRVVCKQEKPIGSHRSIKICRTKEQAGAQADAARRDIDRIRSACDGNVGGDACTGL